MQARSRRETRDEALLKGRGIGCIGGASATRCHDHRSRRGDLGTHHANLQTPSRTSSSPITHTRKRESAFGDALTAVM